MSDTIAVRESNGVRRKPSSTPGGPSRRPVDVFENADEVLLVADVPGISGRARRRARRERDADASGPAPPEENDGNAVAREYDVVDFARTFRIPAGIDTANISAEAKNGTVLVRLPKIAAVKPRKIAVRQG